MFPYTIQKALDTTSNTSELAGDYGLMEVIIGVDTISETDLIRRKWLDNDFYGRVLFNANINKMNVTLGGAWNIRGNILAKSFGHNTRDGALGHCITIMMLPK